MGQSNHMLNARLFCFSAELANMHAHTCASKHGQKEFTCTRLSLFYKEGRGNTTVVPQ
jgi:hypothetical protein